MRLVRRRPLAAVGCGEISLDDRGVAVVTGFTHRRENVVRREIPLNVQPDPGGVVAGVGGDHEVFDAALPSP